MKQLLFVLLLTMNTIAHAAPPANTKPEPAGLIGPVRLIGAAQILLR